MLVAIITGPLFQCPGVLRRPQHERVLLSCLRCLWCLHLLLHGLLTNLTLQAWDSIPDAGLPADKEPMTLVNFLPNGLVGPLPAKPSPEEMQASSLQVYQVLLRLQPCLRQDADPPCGCCSNCVCPADLVQAGQLFTHDVCPAHCHVLQKTAVRKVNGTDISQ